jgi:hypothetical protein
VPRKTQGEPPVGAEEIVRRIWQLLEKADDPALPLTRLEAEAKEHQRLTSEHQV